MLYVPKHPPSILSPQPSNILADLTRHRPRILNDWEDEPILNTPLTRARKRPSLLLLTTAGQPRMPISKGRNFGGTDGSFDWSSVDRMVELERLVR